jgi:hypothetical protein
VVRRRDEGEARSVAAWLESQHPQWMVIFGAYSKEFVCFPRFNAPSGTIVVEKHPPAVADRMRGIEARFGPPASNEGRQG